MRPLFAFIFSVLTVAVYAEQCVSAQVWYSATPMSEAVIIYEMPHSPVVSSSIITTVPDTVYISKPVVSSGPYPSAPRTVAKPTEKLITVPPPLGPLLPLREYPQTGEEATPVVRAQVGVDNLEGILNAPLPPAQGPVESGTIEPKLVESLDASGLDVDVFMANPAQSNAVQLGVGTQSEAKPTDPLGYVVLVFATIVTTIGLVIMAFVAYDYRQRWMQSLTVQNDRYLGGGAFDMEMEDAYSGSISLSDFGIPRRTSI